MAKASKRQIRSETARTTLFRDPACSFALTLYPPGLGQATHSHHEPSVAVLLSGLIEEEAGRARAVAGAGAVGIKPQAIAHSDRYGPDGAVLLSLTVHDSRLWKPLRRGEGWRWLGGRGRAQALAAEALGGRLSFPDLASELLSLRLEGEAAPGRPPRWLAEARARLHASPGLDLAAVAAAAGVHRVHLCRSFSRWFGESISLFRLTRKTELALRDMLYDGASGAAAAAGAGFADQSHLARTVRRLLGTTTGALRAVQREVT
jgi:AraC family transcriptional regulator